MIAVYVNDSIAKGARELLLEQRGAQAALDHCFEKDRVDILAQGGRGVHASGDWVEVRTCPGAAPTTGAVGQRPSAGPRRQRDLKPHGVQVGLGSRDVLGCVALFLRILATSRWLHGAF